MTCTRVILDHLLDDPDTPSTVTQWLRAEPDADLRALKFAASLAEDFMSCLRLPVPDDAPQVALLNVLSRLALDAVNWQRIAQRLLRQFGTPTVAVMQSCHVTPVRLAALAAWHGPVN